MEKFDKGFEVFFNWQTFMVCIGIFLATYAIRRIVETAWVKSKGNKWWCEVALPLGPIGTGILLAMVAKTFPWPMPIADSMWARALYGSICGVASGWVYNRFRSIFKTWSEEKNAKEDAAAAVTPGPAITPGPAQKLDVKAPETKDGPPSLTP
jgi:hypothetical protein